MPTHRRLLTVLALCGLSACASPTGTWDLPAFPARAELGPAGLRLIAPDGAEIEISTVAFGDEALPVTEPIPDGERAVWQRGPVTEWWAPRPGGLEHGFDIPEAPEGGGPIQLVLDAPLLSIDAAGLAATFAFGSQTLFYRDLRAWDDAGRPLPAAMVSLEGRLALSVDWEGALFPVHVDPLLATTAFGDNGYEPAAGLGTAITGIGDVNGDGRADMAVSSPGGSLYGQVQVWYTPASGLPLMGPSLVSWRWSSGPPGSEHGADLAPAGDVNGDGYWDLLVGAPGWDNGQNNEGRALLFLGSSAGLPSLPSWSWESQVADSRLGASVAGAGDLNNDGFADVILGAPDHNNGQLNEGRTVVFMGSATGLGSSPSWSEEGNVIGNHFGNEVASAADMNGDGYGDVVISAPNWNLDRGKVWLYPGSATGLGTWSSSWQGSASSQTFGDSLAPAGDLNGDGYGDLVVGAPTTNGSWGRGQVFHGGAPPLSSAVRTFEGLWTGGSFGTAVAGVGDTNGDGYGDVVITAPGADNGTTDSGVAAVYLGSASGLGSTFSHLIPGATFDRLGGSAGPAGDLDRDGYADLLLGTSVAISGAGRFELHRGTMSGPSSLALATETGTSGEPNNRHGQVCQSAGDLDGDGYADLVSASPDNDNGSALNSGSVRIHSGALGGPSSTPTLTVRGSVGSTALGSELAAGDWDGDGYGDIATTRLDGNDRVEIWWGSATGLTTTGAWIWDSGATSGVDGDVEGLGDVDGDGFDDLAVSDRGANSTTGLVRIFLGGTPGPATAPDLIINGPSSGSYFGDELSATDSNGDGYSDLVVASQYLENGSISNAGGVHVFHGGVIGLTTSATTIFLGSQQDADLGASVDGGGDLDGDGYGDIVVGEPHWDNGSVLTVGRVWVLWGSATGAAIPTAPSFVGATTLEYLGDNVAMVRDQNGDGIEDLIILRKPGGIFNWQLWSGSAGRSFPSNPWSFVLSNFIGSSAGSAGDQNGDGQSDLYVCDPNFSSTAGRVMFFGGGAGETGAWARSFLPQVRNDDSVVPVSPGLTAIRDQWDLVLTRAGGVGGRGPVSFEIEADPWAADFNGVGILSDPPLSLPLAPTPLAETVGGFLPGTALHQRFRLRYDAATAIVYPATRWMDGVANQPTRLHLRVGPEPDADLDGDPDDADCNDGDPTIYTGAPESCDGLDSDCDGDLADVYPNSDADGQPDCIDLDDDGDLDPDSTDCAPTDPSVFSGAPETCDGVDSDCDGSWVDGFLDTEGDGDPDCVDPDDDGDGVLDTVDCAPLDPAVYPGSVEACDSVDGDCDGDFVDGFPDYDNDGSADCVDLDDDQDGDPDTTDCADTNAARHAGATEACDGVDADCDADLVDGFTNSDGDLQPDCVDNDDDNDGSDDGPDCDETNPAVHPAAAESCDAVDSDCDGDFVDGEADGDGDGEPDCVDPDDDGDGSLDPADCDPLDSSIHPGAIEACDTLDSDCDGDGVDGFTNADLDLQPDCVDTDDDGDGSVDAQDCAPLDPTVRPGAFELCDGLDSDCDGSWVDGYADQDQDGDPDCADDDDDGDGEPSATDCDDADAQRFPGASEGAADGVDSDCDGADGLLCFPDLDTDGWGAGVGTVVATCDGGGQALANGDCADDDPARHPAEPELVGDGIDQDCDGADSIECFTDGDGDGHGAGTAQVESGGACGIAEAPLGDDCDDSDGTIFPGALEAGLDGIDQDCDGQDGATCYTDQDGDGIGVGAPFLAPDGACDDAGESALFGDCDDNDPARAPNVLELPDDGIDQDCSGSDDGACWVDNDGDDFGAGAGSLVPVPCGLGLTAQGGDCDDGEDDVFPGQEEGCNGIDDDCDAATVEDEDADGDGVSACEGDCDEGDAAVSPFAAELCNGIDDDCQLLTGETRDDDGDGISLCEGDCDDENTAVGPQAAELCGGRDEDCDGVVPAVEGDADGDGAASCDGDCDDNDATVGIGATELCDGWDQDCDGAAGPPAEDDPDLDGASLCEGDCAPFDPATGPTLVEACDGRDTDCTGAPHEQEIDDDGDGWAECEGDCFDGSALAFPGAPEDAALLIDTNCDGLVGDTDLDGDGVSVGEGDCNDADAQAFPGAAEICDGFDTDCASGPDPSERTDGDQDGAIDCLDCGPLDPQRGPDVVESCNGLDDDCDGLPAPPGELDEDGDGLSPCAGDCDDGEATVRAGLPEDCTDGLDNDCEGSVDQDTDHDQDGVGSCAGDCRDLDETVFPGATELCNGVDDDCDAWVDEGWDVDGDGQSSCAGDCDDGDPTVFRGAPAVCNDDLDNDCLPSTLETEDHDGDGYAACQDPVGDCWEGNPLVHPGSVERCDGLDDDCDGEIDEGMDGDADGYLPCAFDCDDTREPAHPGAVEICGDGLDEDCDLQPDEGCEEEEGPTPPPEIPAGTVCGDCATGGGSAAWPLIGGVAVFGWSRRRGGRAREA